MLELRDLALQLGGRDLIKPFTLTVKPGEIVTIMGASGSGKSSLLSAIGGDLDDAFSCRGEIKLNGLSLGGMAPEQRGIARLFQDDLLFPHMTVGENLLFAIPAMPRSARENLMRAALVDAGLQGFEKRWPQTLSGGQRARVALMRALLSRPNAILLDEPFSKLDQDLRQSIRDYTFAHIAARAIPALLVTHDSGDVAPGGRVLQIGRNGDVSHV